MPKARPISEQVISAASRVVPGWKGSQQVRQDITAAALAYQRGLQGLRSCGQRDGVLRARTYWLLRSEAAKLCAVLLAANKKHQTITLVDAQGMAAGINMHRPCGEAVVVRLKIKKSGAFRPIVVSGVVRTAMQRLIRDIVQASHPISGAEYATAGKGRNAAVTDIVNHMNNTGDRHVVIADVKDFFPSITPEHVAGVVRLPLSVLKASLFLEEGAAIDLKTPLSSDMDLDAVNHSIRTGILQGSLASPPVAALVMQGLMAEVTAYKTAATYVDDALIVAPTKVEAQSIKHALHLRASAHPAGPLVFKTLEHRRITQMSTDVHFLGYRLRVGLEGQVRAILSNAEHDRFLNRLRKQLMGVPSPSLLGFAEAKAVAWIAAQSAADWNETNTDVMIGRAQQCALEELSIRKNMGLQLPKAA